MAVKVQIVIFWLPTPNSDVNSYQLTNALQECVASSSHAEDGGTRFLQNVGNHLQY
jgi:hypothetical protein